MKLDIKLHLHMRIFGFFFKLHLISILLNYRKNLHLLM